MSAHSALTASTGTAPRRRNGRPQACEPCRLRKVACDHSMPVCTRCRSGKSPDSCVYSNSLNFSRRKSRLSRTTPAQETAQRDGIGLTPLMAPMHDGYLGATSYKHAINEAQSNIPPGFVKEGFLNGASTSKPTASQSPIMCNARTYEAALRILRAIPSRAQAYDFSKAHINPNDGWCRLATVQLHDSLWDTFGTVLEGERSTESLVRLATKISENSSQPLGEDYTDPKDWFQSFSGANMRWEGLGILFSHWSFGITEFGQSPGPSQRWIPNFADYVLKYRDCAWDATEITRSTASANTLLLYLLYVQACLESIISGDDSESRRGWKLSLVTRQI